MVYPTAQLDAVKNPQTKCSNCQTVFEVSRDLLGSSDTRVRCGECLSIFDALEELRSAADLEREEKRTSAIRSAAAARAAGISNQSALDVTYSDFDLFSAEADLPEIAYFDQTRDTPDFDFDAIELGNDETFSDTLFVHDVTIDADATTLRAKKPPEQVSTPNYAEIDFVDDEQQREPLIFNYRDAEVDTEDNTVALDGPSGTAGAAAGVSAAVAAGAVVAGGSRASGVQGSKPPPAPSPTPIPTATREPAQKAADLAMGENIASDIAHTEAQAVELEVKKGANPWFFRAGLLVLLLALLGGLFAYRMQPEFYNNSSVRPMLEAGCKLFRCTIPARVDVASLKMVKRNVYSHPNTPNALVINVSFLNDAEFAQQLPILHLVLSNRVGRTVAKQDFAPPDYFQNWNNAAVINSKEQLDVKLEIVDPGQDAQSFEFYFREFKQ